MYGVRLKAPKPFTASVPAVMLLFPVVVVAVPVIVKVPDPALEKVFRLPVPAVSTLPVNRESPEPVNVTSLPAVPSPMVTFLSTLRRPLLLLVKDMLYIEKSKANL